MVRSRPQPGLSPVTLDRGARMLRVLGHPLRLRLVELLVRQPLETRADAQGHGVSDGGGTGLTVGGLAEGIGRSIAVTSGHLRKLHAAGLLVRRRRGKTIHYRVAHPHVARILQMLHQEQYAANTFQGGEAI